MIEKVRNLSDSPETPAEALELDGTVYWVNDDPAVRSIVARLVKGGPTKVPFWYPLEDVDPSRSTDDLAKKRIVAGIHRGHTRHMVFDSPRSGMKVVRKGAGATGSPAPHKPKTWKPERWRVSRLDDGSLYTHGLCDISEAVPDRNVTLLGNKYGGNFGIPLAIIPYDKLPYPDGNSTKFGDMDTLRKVGVLPVAEQHDEGGRALSIRTEQKDFSQAVCYDREVLSNVRFDEGSNVKRAEVRRLVRVLKRLPNSGVKNTWTYLQWLARTHAYHLAILHALDYVTQYDRGNLTFGGHPVDFSNAERVPGEYSSNPRNVGWDDRENPLIWQKRFLFDSIANVVHEVHRGRRLEISDYDSLKEIIENTYTATFNNVRARRQQDERGANV